MKEILSATACVLLATGIFGDSADVLVFTNAANNAKWADTVNWTDAVGGHPERPPTNGEAVVLGAADATAAHHLAQSIVLDFPAGGMNVWPNYYIGPLAERDNFAEVAGDAYHHRSIYVDNGYGALWEYPRILNLMDPNGYLGYWSQKYGHVRYVLPSTADKTLSMYGLSAATRPAVKVPTVGTKAKIQIVHEAGTIEKLGDGELEVGVGGVGVQYHVSAGTLTLNGRPIDVKPDAGDDVPVPGAWLHLDASRTDTMLFGASEGDGRQYVTNWCDVRGNGVYARFNDAWSTTVSHLQKTIHAPFVNGNVVAGKTVMDFGRSSPDQDAALGPVGCALDFSERKDGIREVFCVCSVLKTATQTTVLGDYKDGNYPFHREGNRMASSGYAKSVAYGNIWVNGAPTGNGVGWPTELSVVSVAPTNAIMLGAFATDRYYANRVGGATIAEVLLYTNRLTDVERQQVRRYLARKWRDDGYQTDSDAGSVTLAASTVALSVPAGRKARVDEIAAHGGKLVKKGAGELEIGTLTAATGAVATVDVQAGSVSFVNTPVSTEAPADDPIVWFDATVSDSFVYTNRAAGGVEGRRYIAKWLDRRTDKRHSGTYGIYPIGTTDYVFDAYAWEEKNVVGDKSVVDFGEYASWSHKDFPTVPPAGMEETPFMVISNLYSKASVYDAYVVMRYKNSSKRGGNVFGVNDVAFMRGSSAQLLSGGYGKYQTQGAIWTIDGTAVDPISDKQGDLGTDWHVIGISALTAQRLDFLGNKDRLGQGTGWGGVQVAEEILYTRRLSPSERRQTIAYLMKKWKNADSAAAAETVQLNGLSFAADVPAVVAVDKPLALATLEGANGTLEKRGTGTLTLEPTLYTKAFSQIEVTDGTLNLQGGSPLAAVLAAADFHFDASDATTLTTYEGENGTNYVTEVRDASGKPLVAKPWINDNYYDTNHVFRGICFTNPTLRVVATAPGVEKPVFDFGHANTYYSSAGKDERNHDTSCLRFSGFSKKVREVHEIYSDAYGHKGNAIIGDGSAYHFLRGSSGTLLNSGYADTLPAREGYIAVNGEEVPFNTTASTDFALYSFAPTGAVTVGAIGDDRNITAGGCRVGELIGFTSQLTGLERTYLQNHLMAKWLGRETMTWTNQLDRLAVALGATLNMAETDILAAADVAGAGTVNLGRLIATGALALTAGSPLTVAGTFVQGGPLEATITLPEGADFGDYALLTADAFEDLDLTAWNVTIALPKRGTVRLVRMDDTVFLRYSPKGLVFSFR